MAGLHTTWDMSKLAMAGLPATRGKVKRFLAGNRLPGFKELMVRKDQAKALVWMSALTFLQCFDAVGLVTGRISNQ